MRNSDATNIKVSWSAASEAPDHFMSVLFDLSDRLKLVTCTDFKRSCVGRDPSRTYERVVCVKFLAKARMADFKAKRQAI